MKKSEEVPEMAKATNFGRSIIVFPILKSSLMGSICFNGEAGGVESTLVGREPGDHLTEGPILQKDPQYKKWKAKEAIIYGY